MAARLVLVEAELMATLFHWLSAAPVMLARLLTETVVLTRYAVPVSVLCTTALPELVMVAVVTLAIGAVVSPDEGVFKCYSRIKKPISKSKYILQWKYGFRRNGRNFSFKNV